jgi:hypothetical protein
VIFHVLAVLRKIPFVFSYIMGIVHPECSAIALGQPVRRKASRSVSPSLTVFGPFLSFERARERTKEGGEKKEKRSIGRFGPSLAESRCRLQGIKLEHWFVKEKFIEQRPTHAGNDTDRGEKLVPAAGRPRCSYLSLTALSKTRRAQ